MSDYIGMSHSAELIHLCSFDVDTCFHRMDIYLPASPEILEFDTDTEEAIEEALLVDDAEDCEQAVTSARACASDSIPVPTLQRSMGHIGSPRSPDRDTGAWEWSGRINTAGTRYEDSDYHSLENWELPEYNSPTVPQARESSIRGPTTVAHDCVPSSGTTPERPASEVVGTLRSDPVMLCTESGNGRKRPASSLSVALEATNGSKKSKVNRNRSKNWCFTVNNPIIGYDAVHGKDAHLDDKGIQYIIVGRERGKEEQTDHLQGYVQFQTERVFNKALQILSKVFRKKPHIERQKARQNTKARDYCLKDGVYTEWGQFCDNARNRATKGASVTETRRSVYAQLQSGESTIKQAIDSNPEEILFIERCAKYGKGRQTEAKVCFLYGQTGCGKTFSTNKVLGAAGIDYYKKPPGKGWFDGYRGEKVIVLEEFRTCLSLSVFLSMTDINPPSLEIKGSYMPNMATHFICISNKCPEDQYPNVAEECKAAFMRRLESCYDCSDCTHPEIEHLIESFLGL